MEKMKHKTDMKGKSILKWFVVPSMYNEMCNYVCLFKFLNSNTAHGLVACSKFVNQLSVFTADGVIAM